MRAAPEADALLLEGALRGRHRIELREALVLVKANGRDAAQALLRPSQGWNEWSVVIPAGLVGDGLTRVELAGRYTSFFYWFFQ
jgi:hypothetical protein